MSLEKELIFLENGKLNFGDYDLKEKSKKEDFEFNGDLYKVKTFKEITKLEKNGLLVYESVPGSSVRDFEFSASGVSFEVESFGDLQITVGLEESKEYAVYINDVFSSDIKTNMSGKLVLSAEFEEAKKAKIKLIKK